MKGVQNRVKEVLSCYLSSCQIISSTYKYIQLHSNTFKSIRIHSNAFKWCYVMSHHITHAPVGISFLFIVISILNISSFDQFAFVLKWTHRKRILMDWNGHIGKGFWFLEINEQELQMFKNWFFFVIIGVRLGHCSSLPHLDCLVKSKSLVRFQWALLSL